jgi:cytochrome oxidase Cu insertion factor (SCO1/SenC/PrrC family)
MMGKRQQIVTTVLWGMTVFAMLGLVGTGLWAKKARGRQADSHDALPMYFQAPHFELTDQRKRMVNDDQLRGSVWVAMVFFTNCPDICPGMMGRLVDLQEAVTDPNVKLVSFSIDPERDTPAQLRQYADQLGADSSRWFLLTGTKDQMFAAAEGLKLSAEPAQGEKPISHTNRMLLIDQTGQVRGVYDSADDAAMSKLAADATALAGNDADGSGDHEHS